MTRSEPVHANLVLDAVQSPSRAATSSLVGSWCRSAFHYGLDPAGSIKRERVGASTFNQLREAHEPLLAVAKPVLNQMFRSVGRSGCSVILTDAGGVILETRTEPGDRTDFTDFGLIEGGRWGEAEEGTNGIGTCLHENQPVIIHRDQHFASRNIGVSCMDAPVHDAAGRLVAALDVSNCRADHSIAAADVIVALVCEAARRIERDYFCQHFPAARIIFLADDPRGGTALLAVDRDDLVIGATRGARRHLRLTDDMLASPRPVDEILGNGVAASFGDADRAILRRALASARGNASQAARLLGIGRATLYRRMARAGLHR